VGDESFRVEVVNANGRAIVSLHGEIDMNRGPALREALSAAQQGSPDVIVDLSGVTFMDSTGLHALIGAYHRAPEGGTLAVVGPTSAIRRVFDITGLSGMLLLQPRRPTWQQVTYNHRGWRQWITAETTDDGGPVAEIIEVGSPGDWGSRRVHYALESGEETTIYRSLDEAMRAAELPASVTPHPTAIQPAVLPPGQQRSPADHGLSSPDSGDRAGFTHNDSSLCGREAPAT
jgi:anti-anti-sigma factor